jgi:hypothetical protein
VPEPLRVTLRLLGLVLLIVSVVCLVLIVKPGPYAVAEALGVSCRHQRTGPGEQCTVVDAVTLLWTGFWVALILGGVLRLATRPAGKGPLVLDLRRRRT